MIKRYFYIFSATLFILLTPTTGVRANIDEDRMEELARKTNSPPDGFNYQAVLRDENGDVLTNSSVTMRFTLSNSSGDLWIETHNLNTNAYGVVALVIGEGTQTGGSAASFGAIDWSTDISIKVESDIGSGFVDLGTSALQSVPYAEYAANGLTSEQEASLEAIDLNAEENVQSDWNEMDNTSDAFILNKPSIPTDINELEDADGLLDGSTFDGSFNSLTDVPVNLDTDATDDFSGDYDDLTNKPSIPTDINELADADGLLNGSTFDGSFNSLTDLPANLDIDATDDFSGSYNDLTDLPADLDTDATDDFSGSYNDLTDIPTNLDTDATDDFSGSYDDLTDLPVNLDTDSSDDFSGSYNDLTDLPADLDTDATDDFSGSYNDLTDIPTNLDTDVTDDFSGSYNDLTDLPVNLDTDSSDDFSGSYNDLTDVPANLDTDATDDFSGSYNDLTDVPTNLDTDATDDFSGSYNDLTDLPVNLDTDSSDDFSGSYNDLTDVPANLDTDATDDFSGSYNDLTDIPTNLDTDATDDFSGSYNDLTDLPVNLDTDSSDDFSGSYNDLTDVPANLDTDATDDFSGSYNDLTDVPANLDTDATDDFSGSYHDLTDLPVNLDTDSSDDFSGSYNDLTDVPTNLDTDATDDFSGDYNDLTNKPTIATDVNELADASGLLNTNVSELTNDAGYITNDVTGVFTADELAVSGAFSLPTADGTAGQVLSTNADGTTYWQTVLQDGSYAGSGAGSFVAGAPGNTASGSYATVSGGGSSDGSADNQAGGDFSTVGGGRGNKSLADLSFIGGGAQNYIDADTSFIGGGFKNYINTDEITPSIATIAGGKYNHANGRGDFIGGGYGNRTGYKPNARFNTIAGGENNANDYTTKHTFIGGGRSNRTSGSYSTVAGGSSNFADSLGTVGGGFQNSARGFFSTIPGGHGITTYVYGGVALGMFNSAGSTYGVYSTTSNATTDPVFVIGNGNYNSGSPDRSDAMVVLKNGNTDINGDVTVNALTIEGAFTLPTTDGGNAQFLATFGNGTTTWADPLIFTDNINDDAVTADKIADGVIPSFSGGGTSSFVGGGSSNINDSDYSAIVGGKNNKIDETAFGDGNRTTGNFIGGGYSNYINSSKYSVIGGGHDNHIDSSGGDYHYSTIAGGKSNETYAAYAFVGGGKNNLAVNSSTVAGGVDNKANASFVSIPGGKGLNSYSSYSTVIGKYNSAGSDGGAILDDDFDPFFVIGNGSDDMNRSDLLVMDKAGRTLLNGQLTLKLPGSPGNGITLPGWDGTNGQVLSTDGSGTVSWTDGPTGPTVTAYGEAASVAGTTLNFTVADQVPESIITVAGMVTDFTCNITLPTSSNIGDKITIIGMAATSSLPTITLDFQTSVPSISGNSGQFTLDNDTKSITLVYVEVTSSATTYYTWTPM